MTTPFRIMLPDLAPFVFAFGIQRVNMPLVQDYLQSKLKPMAIPTFLILFKEYVVHYQSEDSLCSLNDHITPPPSPKKKGKKGEKKRCVDSHI